MTRYSDERFNKVYEALEDRLDKLGPITTKEVYSICGKAITNCVIFNDIMDTMVIQKKAVKNKNGEWEILKPNRKNEKEKINTGTGRVPSLAV